MAMEVIRMCAGMRAPVETMTRSPKTNVDACTVVDARCEADFVLSRSDSISIPTVSSSLRLDRSLRDLPFGAPLIRCAWCGTSLLSASIDFSERYSCTKPTVTTIVTAIVMLTASSRLPMNHEITADASSRRIRVSLNCLRNLSQSESSFSCGNSLGPLSSNLASASEGERPWVREVLRR